MLDSEDEDLELQQAFKDGRLQPGLNIEQKQQRPLINNKHVLTAKYDELYLSLPWNERLDCTNAPLPAKDFDMIENEDPELADNDFKREMLFYRQAQGTVINSMIQLKQAKIATKRPDDYYAQMAKSDEHMKKVREYLIERKADIERREKVRKLRELRTFGKKVQQEVLIKRQEEKQQLLKTMKKVRKGKTGSMKELEESLGDRKKSTPNGKRKNINRIEVRNIVKLEGYKNRKRGTIINKGSKSQVSVIRRHKKK